MAKGYTTFELLAMVLIILVILAVVLYWFYTTYAQGSETINCQNKIHGQCGKYILAGGCAEDSELLPVEGGYVEEAVADCAIGSHDEAKVKSFCCFGEEEG